MRKLIPLLALPVLAVLVMGSNALRADPPPAPTTKITVEGMHCMGCAKKIANKLYEVQGVAKVEANVPASVLIVGPQAQRAPSPKAMWEAVERAGYRPSRLEGPSGTFTAKPQS